MSSAAAFVIVALAASAPGTEQFLFRDAARSWTLLAVPGERTRTVSFPDGVDPLDATVAPGRGEILFTARVPSGARLLFAWDWQARTQPRSIGLSTGYHADVAVSRDGAWAYFTYNQDAHGGMGEHGRTFGQLARVHLDGTGFEVLTTAAGCHIGAQPGPGADILFIHATCRSPERALKRFNLATRKDVILTSAIGAVLQAVSTADGKRLLFTRQQQHQQGLWEVRGAGRPTLLSQRAEFGDLRLSSSGNIYFSADGAVWRIDVTDPTPTKVAVLRSAS